jgi:long-chain acyl-CoA synthetase
VVHESPSLRAGSEPGSEPTHAEPGGPHPPVARVSAWLARQTELALAEIDLSLPQYRVLGLLAEGIALPSSMAHSLDVRRPSITAVVDGLVARGLVVRETDPTDRRKVTHSITQAGRQLLARADSTAEARLGRIAAALGDPAKEASLRAGLAGWGAALLAWREQRQADNPVETAPVPRPARPSPTAADLAIEVSAEGAGASRAAAAAKRGSAVPSAGAVSR